MRIGIDARPLLGERTGIGRYVFDLCQEFDRQLPDAQFFAYVPQAEGLTLPSDRWTLRAPHWIPPWAGGYFWFKFLSHGLIAADSLDWFFATRTLLPRLGAGVRSASLVHDLNHVLTPTSMTPINRIAHSLYFRRDVLKATKVIANSRGTATRLRQYCGKDCDAIIPPLPSSQFGPVGSDAVEGMRRITGLQGRYLLSVATLEPRKNIAALLDAFLQMQADGELDGYTLALAGGIGWKTGALARRLQDAPNVVRLGYVADEILPALYAGSDAFVFPSHYEGFGMPVAEALACGTRVICSDIPELRESSRGLATYVGTDAVSIANGIRTALQGSKPNPHPAPPSPDLSGLFEG